MLNTLLNRFRAKPSPPPPVSRPAAPPSRLPATMAAAAPALPAGTGARRPLVSAQGRLAGFEFRAGGAGFDRLQGAAAAACTTNLLGAMRLSASQKMGALAELPAAWLARVPDHELAHGMHLLLRADASCADVEAACALVNRLRRAGVQVGWDPLASPGWPREAGRPDFMPLASPAGDDPAAWRQAVDGAARRWADTPLVLLDLPSVEALEAVLAPPVAWAACRIGGCAEPARAQALPPQAQRALRLLNRLLHDDDHAAVVDDIKGDAALSLRLLQYLNSAGALPGRELDSIEQAVMLLGRDALYRWVAQMLVRMSPPRPAAHALQASALARARLFELLGRATQAPNPGGLYLLGLATMLPMLMQCGIGEAAEALHLPPPAVQALRREGGPWQPYLELVQALEAGDLRAIEVVAAPFGGHEQVFASWAEAWRSA
jgi:EAL and modified HD-GYP domain-containing signal transduction protein